MLRQDDTINKSEIPVKIVYHSSFFSLFSKSSVDLVKNSEVLSTYHDVGLEVARGSFGRVRAFVNEQGEEIAVKSPIGMVYDPSDFDGVDLISSQTFFQKAYPASLSSLTTWFGTFRQVMPKFPGVLLHQALANPTQAYYLDVMLSVAKELDRLHENNIVHGDIKTSNILVNGTDVYFIDFDFSYYADKLATTTSVSHKTCQHWAPERTNTRRKIDASTNQDVYSFAMLFDKRLLNKDFLDTHIESYLDIYREQATSNPACRPSLSTFIHAFEQFKAMQVQEINLDKNNIKII